MEELSGLDYWYSKERVDFNSNKVTMNDAYQDFALLNEREFPALLEHDLALQFEGSEIPTCWTAIDVYQDKLIVLGFNQNKAARWMIGGAVYCPKSELTKLSTEDIRALGDAPWTRDTTFGLPTPDRAIPTVIAPGKICQDSMLSVKRIYTSTELKELMDSDALGDQELRRRAMKLEIPTPDNSDDSYLSLVPHLTGAVRVLSLADKGQITKLF